MHEMLTKNEINLLVIVGVPKLLIMLLIILRNYMYLQRFISKIEWNK